VRAALADEIAQNSERTARLTSIEAHGLGPERIEERERFRQLVEGAPEGIYINRGSGFATYNPALSACLEPTRRNNRGPIRPGRYHPFYRHDRRERMRSWLGGTKSRPVIEQQCFSSMDGFSMYECSAVPFTF